MVGELDQLGSVLSLRVHSVEEKSSKISNITMEQRLPSKVPQWGEMLLKKKKKKSAFVKSYWPKPQGNHSFLFFKIKGLEDVFLLFPFSGSLYVILPRNREKNLALSLVFAHIWWNLYRLFINNFLSQVIFDKFCAFEFPQLVSMSQY